MSKTGRFYLALQEEREMEGELRSRLESVISDIARRDPAIADRLQVEIAEIESHAHRVFSLAWKRVEPSLSSESSEILDALVSYVCFLLSRECEKWMLGSSASE